MAQQQCRSAGVHFNSGCLNLGTTLIRLLCQRATRGLPVAVCEDCESEAWLALWQLQAKLLALPAADRVPYALVCIRRHLTRYYQAERQYQARTISLEALELGERRFSHSATEQAPEETASVSELLREQIADPDLAAALAALPVRDQALLELTYLHRLTDPEIARYLHLADAAVKMRRHRVLARLRRQLCITCCGSGSHPSVGR